MRRKKHSGKGVPCKQMLLSGEDIKKVELDLLLMFQRWCEGSGSYYSLAYGTLIGAVRHHGFIPWDDDIDVYVPRRVYRLLVERLRRGERIGEYKLVPYGPICDSPLYLKLVDTRYSVVEHGRAEIGNLWIDIFPVDGVPNGNKEAALVFFVSRILQKCILFPRLTAYDTPRGFIKYAIGRTIKTTRFDVLSASILRRIEAKYEYDKCDKVACVCCGYGPGEIMSKSEFEKPTDLLFEGHRFKAVSCYDSLLKALYGDYMSLPPVEDRVSHRVDAWRSQNE